MRFQRKIFHLLVDNGIIGRGFRYLPEMNPRHSFNWAEPVLITDKIDGTTCQFNLRHVYQRRDKFKKGDPRKFTASEDERYRLELLDPADPANQHIFKAVKPYLPKFSLDGSIVTYFESFGKKIQARYKDYGPDIRVFDVTYCDEWIPFDETVSLCQTWGLPCVKHALRLLEGGVKQIIETLPKAHHLDPDLQKYDLEGWVLRQGTQIAKIRKTDLKRLTFEVRT